MKRFSLFAILATLMVFGLSPPNASAVPSNTVEGQLHGENLMIDGHDAGAINTVVNIDFVEATASSDNVFAAKYFTHNLDDVAVDMMSKPLYADNFGTSTLNNGNTIITTGVTLNPEVLRRDLSRLHVANVISDGADDIETRNLQTSPGSGPLKISC